MLCNGINQEHEKLLTSPFSEIARMDTRSFLRSKTKGMESLRLLP